MKIEITPSAGDAGINPSDMPQGSIGLVSNSVENPSPLYLIRTESNGDEFIKVWHNSNAIEYISPRNADNCFAGRISLLPKGTKITITL